jgi:hypothetical protein
MNTHCVQWQSAQYSYSTVLPVIIFTMALNSYNIILTIITLNKTQFLYYSCQLTIHLAEHDIQCSCKSKNLCQSEHTPWWKQIHIPSWYS